MGSCVSTVLADGEGGAKCDKGHSECASEAEPAICHKSAPSMLEKSVLGRHMSTDVTEKYELGKVLGRGAFATTRLCTRTHSAGSSAGGGARSIRAGSEGGGGGVSALLEGPGSEASGGGGGGSGGGGGGGGSERGGGEQFACKSILKRRLHPGGGDVREEMQIMLHLTGHPHVVGLVGSFEDNAYVHLVMELCPGGDLVSKLLDKGRYTERDAAAIIRAVLGAVAYAHDMGCMHRDIKLENCLLKDDADVASVELADWGYGTFIKPGQQLHQVCGTSFYMAPEMLNGSYDEKADVWSCGVLLYILLAGQPPFYAACDEAVMRKIKNDGVPNMTCHPWEGISDAAKEAVMQMMSYDPACRPTARDMLAHEWIREDGVAGDTVLEPEVVHRLRDFSAMNQFRRDAAMAIASHLPVDQIRGLHEIFKSMDLDGNGTITPEELRQAMSQRGYKLPDDELDQLMAIADVNCDGQIDYSEFVAATLHTAVCLQEDNLVMAFKHFDLDGDGRITREELEQALAAMGRLGSNAAEIIASVDQNGDGVVDYLEFVDMMSCKHAKDGLAKAAGLGAGGGSGGSEAEQQQARPREGVGGVQGPSTPDTVDVGPAAALAGGGAKQVAV